MFHETANMIAKKTNEHDPVKTNTKLTSPWGTLVQLQGKLCSLLYIVLDEVVGGTWLNGNAPKTQSPTYNVKQNMFDVNGNLMTRLSLSFQKRR